MAESVMDLLKNPEDEIADTVGILPGPLLRSKAPLHTKFPILAKRALARGFTKGFKKHHDSWMRIIEGPGGIEYFLNHAIEHIDQHIDGKTIDNDGELNLTHAVMDLLFIIEKIELAMKPMREGSLEKTFQPTEKTQDEGNQESNRVDRSETEGPARGWGWRRKNNRDQDSSG